DAPGKCFRAETTPRGRPVPPVVVVVRCPLQPEGSPYIHMTVRWPNYYTRVTENPEQSLDTRAEAARRVRAPRMHDRARHVARTPPCDKIAHWRRNAASASQTTVRESSRRSHRHRPIPH